MTQPQQPSKALHIALWVAQILLALLFLMGARMKFMTPIEELAAQMPWMGQVSPVFLKFTGVLDALAGIGLIFPALLRIKPILTPWAAVGAAALMVCATVFHVSRGEASVIGLNVVAALMAVFVAWGRFVKAPVLPK